MDRATADEALADAARRQLREHGFVPIEPDDRIGRILAPDELVVAVRRSVSLERRVGRPWPGFGAGQLGDLYVTTDRLVHLGRDRVDFPLSEIRDAIEAHGTLRLVVVDEPGIEIQVEDPRLLRVQIAAVRESARASTADVGSDTPVRSSDARSEVVLHAPPATDDQTSSR